MNSSHNCSMITFKFDYFNCIEFNINFAWIILLKAYAIVRLANLDLLIFSLLRDRKYNLFF